MTDLAERIERAEGPSRELDAEIHALFNSGRLHPRYTASLDAAMMLVPEGAPWKVEDHPEWSVSAVVNDTQCFAATPALALCAAALRAKEQ